MRILHVINGLAVARGGPAAMLAALAPAQVRQLCDRSVHSALAASGRA
jgi:hypothetical protein